MGIQSVAPIIFDGVGVSQVTATNSVELGTRTTYNGTTYLYVFNGGNSQAVPNLGVTVSGLSGYTVTVSSVTGGDAFAGFVQHVTLTTNTYGWVAVQGFVSIKCPANSSVAAGDLIGVGTDGVVAPAPLAGTSVTAILIMGKCVGATASAGTGRAYVKTLFA